MHENLRDLQKNKTLLRKQNRPPPGGDGPNELVLLFTSLFTTPFTRQSFLHAFLLAWFEVKGMSLDFLDNVFLLYLSLKATQGIFEGFSLLQSDFCQLNYTPKLVQMGRIFIARFYNQVKRYRDQGTAALGPNLRSVLNQGPNQPIDRSPGCCCRRQPPLVHSHEIRRHLMADKKPLCFQRVGCCQTD
jgi:hypothetical protein